ncbi:hypothetical protein [Pedobacter caeni]|uniref:Uncharacterized protein n=1 Tax=Pedobacter caeni TaxID=288992 RepID=A0A1M5MLT3_9SPHI|nr:hypothetical protein [Pedobacter caeni]SHG77869.1 hypothetical protein SAMN04488522_107225 [Pedobacter caeni]
MDIYAVVKAILKEKKRPFTWLVRQMDMTSDGLKLALKNESIKYRDINRVAGFLEVSPYTFFDAGDKPYKTEESSNLTAESKNEYSSLKNSLKNCKEMSAALKEQIKDKEVIIALLKKG